MPISITDLPPEVLTSILSYLRNGDLCHLCLTSKSFQKLSTSLLWTHIELHTPDWHRKDEYNEDNIPRPLYLTGRRRYIYPPNSISEDSIWPSTDYYLPDRKNYEYMQRTQRFLVFFKQASQPPHPSPHHARYSIIARRVRSLCLTVSFEIYTPRQVEKYSNIWPVFSKFQNLESLELIVGWPDMRESWDYETFTDQITGQPLQALTKLNSLRLRGYISRCFALWLLSHPESLTTLELTLLDRPISSSFLYEPENPPPPQKANQYPLEDIEPDSDSEIPWVTEENDSDASSVEDLDHETVSPRPLYILQRTDIPDRLTNLSTLILVRPSEGRDYQEFNDIYTSILSDDAILHDWKYLIQATRRTLQHLVLDQRVTFTSRKYEYMDNKDILHEGFFGPGFTRFMEITFPTLIEAGVEWPALQTIQMYGFWASDLPEDTAEEWKVWCREHETLLERLDLDVRGKTTFKSILKDRFQNSGASVSCHLGNSIEFDPDSGVMEESDGFGGLVIPDEEEEDDG